MALALEAVTHAIIGAAIDVHRRLGPGFLESIYANAHRLDLLVGQTVVVELKALRRLDDVHFAVVRSYLRAAGLEHMAF